MRLALHPTTEAGQRAGRILLSEPELEALGIYGHRSGGTEDRRSMAITELAGFALLISDDATAPLDLAVIAAEDGLSCVLAADPAPPPLLATRFATQGLTLLLNAGAPGLAEALRFHERLSTGPGREVLVAWTTEGKPLRRGVAVPFPDPLGARWGRRLPSGKDPLVTRVEVPVEGPWGGALARTAGRRDDHRLVAAADERQHLAALALAAGALLVARGGLAPGVMHPADAAAAYLQTAGHIGLEIAGFDAGA
ncbi:MAG TPA: hypothetical protein VLS92_06180 [Acidimicrobiia bacterium]|nr:hypothetical protein [Acidimicrobiia bacterium]